MNAAIAHASTTGSWRACLDDGAILHNYGELRARCDFVVDDGFGVPAHVARDPRSVDAFVSELDRVRDGAVVCVKTNMVDDFFVTAFPLLRARIVLVTIGSDWSTPGPYANCLADPRILRWFGQNCDLPAAHPKFEQIPLGFAEPHWPHGDQAALLRVHRRMPAVTEKPLRAYSTFQLRSSHPERERVWRQIRGSSVIIAEPCRIPPELLWIRHANYAFEICPRGAGPDCHRTWEALLLRTIPILQTSALDPLYDGFPVVLVEDWREVTREALARWRTRFADRFTAEMFDRLTAGYWLSRIATAAGRQLREEDIGYIRREPTLAPAPPDLAALRLSPQ